MFDVFDPIGMLGDPVITCHCGRPVIIHPDGFTRGMCEHCDSVRCDAYPMECRLSGPMVFQGLVDEDGSSLYVDPPIEVPYSSSVLARLDPNA